MEVRFPRTALIIGAGYIGMRLARMLAQNKVQTFATTRSSSKSQALAAQNIEPITLELNDATTWSKLPFAEWVFVCVAPDERTEAAYERVYGEFVPKMVTHLSKNPPNRFLYTGSTGVFADNTDIGWVDESTPIQATSRRAKSLLAAEQAVVEAPFPSLVFRLSGIYGPLRNRLADFRAGRIPLDYGGNILNIIHCEDVVQGSIGLMSSAASNEVVIGVDDHPFPKRDLFDWLAAAEKVAKLNLDSTAAPHRLKKYSNKKLKSFGYQFKFSTFKDGYESLLTAN